MRTVAFQAIVMTIFMSSAALASDVRHSRFPESVVGMWAPGLEACKDDTKSTVTLSATAYDSSDTSCTVDWVNETASANGPVYSAHAQCSKISAPAQKIISNLMVQPKDNNQISIGPDFDNLKVYRRCTSK
jgi:hypothetical protein